MEKRKLVIEKEDKWICRSPGSVVSWMKACHKAAELEFIYPWQRHLKQAKRLLGKYSATQIKVAIRQCAEYAQHPFTLKFVERQLRVGTNLATLEKERIAAIPLPEEEPQYGPERLLR